MLSRITSKCWKNRPHSVSSKNKETPLELFRLKQEASRHIWWTHLINCVVSTFRVKCLGTGFSASVEANWKGVQFTFNFTRGKHLCKLGTSLSLLVCGGREKGFGEGDLLPGWPSTGCGPFLQCSEVLRRVGGGSSLDSTHPFAPLLMSFLSLEPWHWLRD